MTKFGAVLENINIRYYDEYSRGVEAMIDIYKDKAVLSIPEKAIITAEMGFNSPIG